MKRRRASGIFKKLPKASRWDLIGAIPRRTIGNPDTSVRLLPRSAFRFINAPREMAGNLGRDTYFGQITNILNDGRTFRFLLRVGF
jgi:hypothetical protein